MYFQKINGTIDWQPIPVHTVPLEDDNVSDTINEQYVSTILSFGIIIKYGSILIIGIYIKTWCSTFCLSECMRALQVLPVNMHLCNAAVFVYSNKTPKT